MGWGARRALGSWGGSAAAACPPARLPAAWRPDPAWPPSPSSCTHRTRLAPPCAGGPPVPAGAGGLPQHRGAGGAHRGRAPALRLLPPHLLRRRRAVEAHAPGGAGAVLPGFAGCPLGCLRLPSGPGAALGGCWQEACLTRERSAHMLLPPAASAGREGLSPSAAAHASSAPPLSPRRTSRATCAPRRWRRTHTSTVPPTCNATCGEPARVGRGSACHPASTTRCVCTEPCTPPWPPPQLQTLSTSPRPCSFSPSERSTFCARSPSAPTPLPPLPRPMSCGATIWSGTRVRSCGAGWAAGWGSCAAGVQACRRAALLSAWFQPLPPAAPAQPACHAGTPRARARCSWTFPTRGVGLQAQPPTPATAGASGARAGRRTCE